MRLSVALVSILAVAVWASGQTAGSRPAFDVTSVKPAGGVVYLAFRNVPGGVHLEGPLSFFIRRAYRVQDYQVEGGPGWMESENYVVEGKAATTHSQREMESMLQALLEDRFALKMHHETRGGPVYSLLVARKGSKMKRFEGNCVDAVQGKPLEPGTTACGYRPGLGAVDAKGVSVAVLADFLSAIMGRPVVDKTGLSGRFDFHLDYKIDQATAGFRGAADSNADDSGATIFTALQEQLGLQLKSDTGARDYLVIDRAEKPSEN